MISTSSACLSQRYRSFWRVTALEDFSLSYEKTYDGDSTEDMRERGYQALVSGESLGQVASQTMYAMVCTDAACRMPVFRPCVGMDKSE